MHRASLVLGAAAFAGPAFIMATLRDFTVPSAAMAFFIAGAAGATRVHTGGFFAGAMLAFGCWICLAAIFDPAADLGSAIIMVPFVFLMVLTVGGGGVPRWPRGRQDLPGLGGSPQGCPLVYRVRDSLNDSTKDRLLRPRCCVENARKGPGLTGHFRLASRRFRQIYKQRTSDSGH